MIVQIFDQVLVLVLEFDSDWYFLWDRVLKKSFALPAGDARSQRGSQREDCDRYESKEQQEGFANRVGSPWSGIHEGTPFLESHWCRADCLPSACCLQRSLSMRPLICLTSKEVN